MKIANLASLSFLVFSAKLAVAAAIPQTVAVMPFRDLSGAKASIGEAIRETVTSDLKDISGMKVIERGSLDRVLAEQKLQGTTDFDPQTSSRLGKLLGATLIVTGAYQKASSSVRLTARFVKVETGEIVGSAKVDGSTSDFLSLQDKVTAELLKSAGIEKKTIAKVASRSRPKIKSLKAVEFYGDAVVEPDESKKRELLKLAVKEDPQFIYAARDLDELEKRLKVYDSVNKLEQARAVEAFKKKLQTETNPQMLYGYYAQYLSGLAQQHKWRTVAAECRAIIAHAPSNAPEVKRFANRMLIDSYNMIKDYDAALREGERALALYPGTMEFQAIRAAMDSAIDKKREIDEGKPKAAEELAKLTPAERADPCKVGPIYNSAYQHKEGYSTWLECKKAGNGVFGAAQVEQFLMIAAYHSGQFQKALQHMKEIEKLDPKMYRSTSAMLSVIPVD